MKSFLHSIRALLNVKRVRSFIMFFVGLAALAWFLIRVIPKPSRATYPCQQAAFPFASAFVIWLSGILTSSFIFVKARRKWRRARYIVAAILFFIAMAIFLVTSTTFKNTPTFARAYMFSAGIFGSSSTPLINNLKLDSTAVSPVAFIGGVKSNQSSASDIDFAEIMSMLTEAIDLAGGLEGIISNGDTVILKPNLVTSQDGTASSSQLAPEVNGITTDYRLMQALVNIVRDINPNGKIYIMEGSATGSTANNMAILNYDQITGIDSLLCLEDVSGDWSDTNSIYLQGVSLPQNKVLYPGNNRYWLHKLYFDADVLISVPVLKNHYCTGTTGSIKNVGIGATPATIYANYPDIMRLNIDHVTPPLTNLHYFIHDYFMCRPVDFVVVDGLQGLENGPVSSTSTPVLSMDQKNMRLIMAGKDPLAMDAISALLTGQDPELITHLSALHNHDMGCLDARLVRVKGIKVGDEKKAFELWSYGALSAYNDFEPPEFSIIESYLSGDQIYFSLDVDEEVTKVEVSVDGEYLDQIIIDNFDGFYIDPGNHTINSSSEVIVYAYDKYLNYSSHEVINVSMDQYDDHYKRLDEIIHVYPNPARHEISIESDGYKIRKIRIYSLGGQQVQTYEWPDKKLDISALQSGAYLIEIWVQDMKIRQKLLVE